MPPAPGGFPDDNNSLVGGIAGAVLTVGLLWISQFFARPRPRLHFNGTDDACLAESTHPEGDMPDVTRKYLRVNLRSAGLFGRHFGGLSGAKKTF